MVLEIVYFKAHEEELLKLIAHVGNIEYKQTGLEGESWKEHKPATRYGQLPYLKVSDDFYIYQTLAIARYLAQEGNLYPATNQRREIALSEEVVSALNEVLIEFFRVFYETKPEEREQELNKFKEGTLKRIFSGLNSLLEQTNCGYFIQGMLTWADLFMFEILLNLESVGIDYLSGDKFTSIQRLKQQLMKHPLVESYLKTIRK